MDNLVNSWNHSKISTAGRVVLINGSLLSMPSYMLSCYPVPDLILDEIPRWLGVSCGEMVAIAMAFIQWVGTILHSQNLREVWALGILEMLRFP